MKLTLINHACCKLETESCGILFDPWTEGPVFNFGWDLLIPTPMDFDAIMAGVSFIWISHEHPDHFSIRFLSEVAKSRRDDVAILFQTTRDKRVAGFCRSLGLRVRELPDGVPVELDGHLSITCGAFDFYDSWLYLSDGKHSILNLNDCPVRSERQLRRIGRSFPRPDVLLSQFSYAAWKGGRDNREFRALAAKQKLEWLALQIRTLRPKYVLPFASFAYFSNEENSYLNDAVNTPRRAAEAIAAAGVEPVILYPGESWMVGSRNERNDAALELYDQQYARVASLPLRAPGPSADVDELRAAFAEYRAKVFARNLRPIVWLLSKLPLLGAFRPLVIRLSDLDLLVSVSIVSGLAEMPRRDRDADVVMHSSSLLFIFRNDFGFDTLTVNGRFEATAAGFSKMTRSLSIGSLNAMGLSLSWSLLRNPRVVLILLRRLQGVLTKLARSSGSPAAASPEG